MSQRGRVIDSQRFARGGQHVDGRVELTELPRLADQVVRFKAPLEYALNGSREDDKLFLDLTVIGDVWLSCQRCLGELPFPLRLSSRFLLVAEGEEWPDEELADDRYDAIPGDPEMDVLALIEDEVLLALPIVPRHDSCAVPDYDGANERGSPFGALERLKRH